SRILSRSVNPVVTRTAVARTLLERTNTLPRAGFMSAMVHRSVCVRKLAGIPRLRRAFALLLTASASTTPSPAADDLLDFTAARVVFPADSSGPEKKAVEMLLDEAAKRTGAR